MIRNMRETSSRDFNNLERLIYTFPELSTLSSIQRDVYYSALARALIFGWIQMLEGRVNRENIIRIFARVTTPTIHRFSYRFLEENNLHPEWFAEAISSHIRNNDVPPFIWRRLLSSDIAVGNTSLAILLIRKFRHEITEEMKENILNLISIHDARNTFRYREVIQ